MSDHTPENCPNRADMKAQEKRMENAVEDLNESVRAIQKTVWAALILLFGAIGGSYLYVWTRTDTTREMVNARAEAIVQHHREDIVIQVAAAKSIHDELEARRDQLWDQRIATLEKAIRETR